VEGRRLGPADRPRDTAPAVSRVTLALCAGTRDPGLDRDPVTMPVALPGRRSAGEERNAAVGGRVARERPPQARHRGSGVTRPCSYDPPKATPEIVAERQHPGIDDLQSSSFAGLTAGGVECNSTIPGEGPRMRRSGCNEPPIDPVLSLTGCTIPWYVPYFTPYFTRDETSRDRRLAVVVFRRPGGRRGRVQLDHPGREHDSVVRPVFLRERCHEMKHPRIDDLQSSSFAGLAAGGVECNSTIPGEGTIPWYVPYFFIRPVLLHFLLSSWS
jgi:hypothetical protein